ncbi:MAG TPA: twin-arginine translocation signal domain-containing protein, partial [Chloroflexota bacterium]|nr:twin-arginine translocation signal domain-containing protein [Chloroflexota bacterium]
MTCSRRDFLKIVATSAGGAALFAGCGQLPPGIPPQKEFQLQSAAAIPEDYVTGVDNLYATICQQCTAGCGILVRVVEGRAKKIEGNPNHPVNGPKHCARAEAALQGLYHPDRLQGPMRRTGERGSGQFQPISWE